MNNLSQHLKCSKICYILALIACCFPLISPAVALLLGVAFAQCMPDPFPHVKHRITQTLLQVSVIGLGFGMDVYSTLKVGQQGLGLTVISIFLVLIAGLYIGKRLGIDRKISFLIAAGTAICGGSAIAALSPVISAKEKQISVALGTIFILNALALFIFPMVGHFFQMSQNQFGLWCAIAIHDTSSVVGAASKYGAESLMIATTVKLARSLWIIPIALFLSLKRGHGERKSISFPYFILGFIAAILANTYVPIVQSIAPFCVSISKIGLTMTLFFIGSSLAFSTLKSIGIKPLLQGVILWIWISIATLYAIMMFF